MHSFSSATLIGALVLLIMLSAFFSASEISMMAMNRYRLRHRAESGNRFAAIVLKLLARPERLLGVILLGNNLANILASSVATVLALKHFGEPAIAAASFLLTLVILVFAEVAPKTLAAVRPDSVAYPAGYILHKLLFIAYPFVWVVNLFANLFLRMLGIKLDQAQRGEISIEELRGAVTEAKSLIPKSHKEMLLGILELQAINVDEVMVPRGEIAGVDIDADSDDILARLTRSNYTRMPVYRGSLDNVVGILHIRKTLNLIKTGDLNAKTIERIMASPYFIPENTPLSTQLLNFKANKRRLALVIDEYGDIKGLLTLEEILEEIVGEFTKDTLGKGGEAQVQEDGSYIISGNAQIRELNRNMGWNLPRAGSRTLNGLITETLEDIPESGTSLTIGDYRIEILKARGTAVKVAKVFPVAMKADADKKEVTDE